MNMLFTASLNKVWSMINTQQIIALCPLLQINMPANVMFFFNKLLIIASFDIIPTDKIYDKINILKSSETLPIKLQEMGFGNILFIRNM